MYGARSTAERGMDPETRLWEALSAFAETARLPEGLDERSTRGTSRNTHGTFHTAAHEHRIDVENQRDCCDRGFSSVVGHLARRWVRFAEDHELLSKIVSASVVPVPFGFAFSVMACAGVARNNDAMVMCGGVLAGSFGVMWLGLLAMNIRELVEREVNRYC